MTRREQTGGATRRISGNSFVVVRIPLEEKYIVIRVKRRMRRDVRICVFIPTKIAPVQQIYFSQKELSALPGKAQFLE